MVKEWVVSAHIPKVERLKSTRKTKANNSDEGKDTNKDPFAEVSFSTPLSLISAIKYSSCNNNEAYLASSQVLYISHRVA